mgnify:CR=1 FL=1
MNKYQIIVNEEDREVFYTVEVKTDVKTNTSLAFLIELEEREILSITKI